MQQQNDIAGYTEPGAKNVTLIYILYLVGFIIGLTVLVGVIFAYLNRGKSQNWVDSHYTFQIRTFWIAFLFSLLSIVLMFVGIGFLMILVVAVWTIIRCVKGLQACSRGEAIQNPQTWMF